MPALVHLTTIAEPRGHLTVIEKGIPFPVKRVFYTYNVPEGAVRGGHRHKKNRTALMVPAGTCDVSGITPGKTPWTYRLDDPSVCLVLEPEDWHQMTFVAPGTILLCLASEEYDPEDYIYDAPVGPESFE